MPPARFSVLEFFEPLRLLCGIAPIGIELGDRLSRLLPGEAAAHVCVGRRPSCAHAGVAGDQERLSLLELLLSGEARAEHAVHVEPFPGVWLRALQYRRGFPKCSFGFGIALLLKPDPANIGDGDDGVDDFGPGHSTLDLQQMIERLFGVCIFPLARVVFRHLKHIDASLQDAFTRCHQHKRHQPKEVRFGFRESSVVLVGRRETSQRERDERGIHVLRCRRVLEHLAECRFGLGVLLLECVGARKKRGQVGFFLACASCCFEGFEKHCLRLSVLALIDRNLRASSSQLDHRRQGSRRRPAQGPRLVFETFVTCCSIDGCIGSCPGSYTLQCRLCRERDGIVLAPRPSGGFISRCRHLHGLRKLLLLLVDALQKKRSVDRVLVTRSQCALPPFHRFQSERFGPCRLFVNRMNRGKLERVLQRVDMIAAERAPVRGQRIAEHARGFGEPSLIRVGQSKQVHRSQNIGVLCTLSAPSQIQRAFELRLGLPEKREARIGIGDSFPHARFNQRLLVEGSCDSCRCAVERAADAEIRSGAALRTAGNLFKEILLQEFADGFRGCRFHVCTLLFHNGLVTAPPGPGPRPRPPFPWKRALRCVRSSPCAPPRRHDRDPGPPRLPPGSRESPARC